MKLLGIVGAAAFALQGLDQATWAQSTQPVRMDVVAHVLRPAVREPQPELIRQLHLPGEFELNVFARELGNIRMFAVADDGTLYATRRTEGDVLFLRDTNQDGVADSTGTAVTLKDAHGIALREGKAYIATIREVYVGEIQPNGKFGEMKRLIEDLPDGGQHPNRTLGFGPDGKLYISVGSSCNACNETNPEHATILQAEADGSQRRVFARGLRNTIGFGWHPQTGQMWGLDHGSDWLGNDKPPEELNRIVEDGHYGWPWGFGRDGIDESQPWPEDRETSKKEFLDQTVKPVLTYTAHSAPLGLVFYTAGQFPQQYRNSAFATMRGSWNRQPASGYEVVFIRYQDGSPIQFESFLTGFLIEEGRACFGRPVGIAVAADGSLLIGDDTKGMIYRISHRAGVAGR